MLLLLLLTLALASPVVEVVNKVKVRVAPDGGSVVGVATGGGPLVEVAPGNNLWQGETLVLECRYWTLAGTAYCTGRYCTLHWQALHTALTGTGHYTGRHCTLHWQVLHTGRH